MVVMKLKDCCTIIAGQSPESKYYNADGIGIPFFQGKADFGELYPTVRVYCSQPTKIAEKDDILLSVRAPVGATNLAPRKVCIGRGLTAIRPRSNLELKYLLYFFRYFQAQLQAKGTGTAFKAITQRIVRDIELPVPSLPEQKRIVEKIEELFSELDSGVETLKKTKQQLAVYRQAVLKAAFDSVNAPCRRLEDLCFFITKGTTPPKTAMTSGVGDVPFVKVYNLTFNNSLDFSIDPTFVSRKIHSELLGRSIVYPGDVLMNIVGPPMGKVSIVPDAYPEWNINQAIVRFRCMDGLHNKYLSFFLGYFDTVKKMVAKAKATAGQFNLTLEICRDIQIPLPSIEVQKEVAGHIESCLSVCDSIGKTVDAALQQAEAMRQSILKKAFEGKL